MQGIVHCAVATRVGIQMTVFGGRILGKDIFPYYARARIRIFALLMFCVKYTAFARALNSPFKVNFWIEFS